MVQIENEANIADYKYNKRWSGSSTRAAGSMNKHFL